MNTNSGHLLQAVLEGFVDGILVLTDRYDVIYANAMAESICAELRDSSETLPPDLQRVCDALIDSRDLYSQPITIESEVTTQRTTLTIRAQWLQLDLAARPCLLLRLQDEQRVLHGLAIAEAQQWHLTARESEVWLLRRSGYSRKQIATDLYIALDTVKKHLKNIQSKRQAALDDADWQSNQAC